MREWTTNTHFCNRNWRSNSSIQILTGCDACIQAHLFDAKQLQRACLAFIKENLEAVAITPGPLHRKWGSLFAYFSFSLILFCSILAADDTCNTSIWVESHCEFEVSEAHYRLARSDAESHPLQCRLSTNWMWLLTSQFLDHLYLLGSQKVIGLQPFAGVIYIYINISIFVLRFCRWWMHCFGRSLRQFDWPSGGCTTRKPARAETQEIWMIWNDLKKEMTGIRFGAQRNCWAPIDFGYLPGTANQTANWNDSAVLNEEIAFLFLFGA